jgi:hypothetical protein
MQLRMRRQPRRRQAGTTPTQMGFDCFERATYAAAGQMHAFYCESANQKLSSHE